MDIRRNPVLLVAHWVMSTIMGIGLGFIFFDVKRDFAGLITAPSLVYGVHVVLILHTV